MRDTACELSEQGGAALAERRWQDARELFERALAEQRTPERLEGLAWATWWLDDAQATFAARESAHRLFAQRGEDAGAARCAIWLAGDHADFRGEMALASGWLRRARRLLEPLEPVAEHGWLAFYEGYFAAAAGDPASAHDRGVDAADLGRRLGVADLEMLGLALAGSALLTLAQIDEGMRCLDDAAGAALAGNAEFPISIGWTCCFLIAACEAVGDLERACEWCDRVAEFSTRHGSSYLLGICRTHYAAIHLWRGDWARAEDGLVSAAADFARSRPPYAGGALTWLAELRRRQGRVAEAEELVAQAGEHSRGALCSAVIALERGDALEAAELAERVLRRRPAGARMERAAALEVLIRARAARAEFDAAEVALAELRDTARLVGSRPRLAAVRHAEGIVRAAAGEHARARPLLEDACDLYAECGGRYEAAQARTDLAASLVALGRADAAGREARTALAAFEQLGAAPAAERARGLAPDDRPRSVLTAREQEVLRLVAAGLTNAQIAERLVVSRHTVHRHVANLLRKLDLPSRAAAAAHAARAGMLE